jgi:L-alanine-DL-glutamate epimerase-like enolase superfamily enzyme
LRKAVGDEMILMMDTLIYPGPYSRRDALRVGRVLDELNFYWFEDPLPKTDLDGLAELCRSLETRILMGERVSSFSEYTQFIDRHATDILRGNLSMGGITGVLKIAHLAEAHNMNIEIHSFFGALEPASLHAMLAINNSDYYEQSVPEGVFDERMYPGVFKDVIRIDDNGYVHAPKKPGLGYDIDLGQVEKVTVERLSS